VRRSFDGGLTWTTTPSRLGGRHQRDRELLRVNLCRFADCVGTEFVYGAGDFEQGRNVSQLIGNKITILDPRYSPTGGLKLYPTIRTDWPDGHELLYDSDIIFRRLMYVPDGATTTLLLRPLASVLYLSSPTITAGLDDDILDGVFTGIVKSIGDKFWTIGNYSVRVTKDTEIKETIVVGDYVKVKFVWDSTTMVATEIELEDDDDLIIVGTGRIRNHAHQGNQIEAYRWRSQSGNVCAMDLVDDDGDGLVECEQILQLKAHQFATNRWHIFTLDVLDSAGNWSAPVSVSIYVSDGNFYLMLPVMSRN
jgi:hypothetical protein